MLELPAATCRRCETPVPAGTPDELFALGWGDSGTLCPSCRSARNARAAATTNRIVGGLTEIFASQHAGSRTVTVRDLPSMAIRSSWVAWGADAISGQDAREMWRELGPGGYLVIMKGTGAATYVAVDVDDDGSIDMEPVAEQELGALIALTSEPEADALEPAIRNVTPLH